MSAVYRKCILSGILLVVVGYQVFSWLYARAKAEEVAKLLAEVTIKEERSPGGYLNPHHSPVKNIHLFGKTYRDVAGVVPSYLWIPELESVLFVLNTKGSSNEVHIVNLRNRKASKFMIPMIGFGNDIGFRTNNIRAHPEIDSNGDVLVIVEEDQMAGYVRTTQFNLTKQSMILGKWEHSY